MEETLTLIEKTAFLSTLPVLSAVPTEALAQLAAQTRERHLDAGDFLFREGDANTGAVVVVDGHIELRRGRSLLRVMSPGQAFGELFSKDGAPHVFSAIAIEHAHVLTITIDDVFDGMLDFPEFAVGMVVGIARRNRELMERLLELENVLGRFHERLKAAGLEPPEAPSPTVGGAAPGVE